MKTSSARFVFAVALLASAALAGCTSTSPRRPVVHYPVTYDVPFGSTQVNASTGKQDLEVNATQRVEADVGDPLYFQIASPVPVSVAVFERKSPDAPRTFVRELQGTNFNGSLVPASPNLEFVFSAPKANSSGNLRFTLSDKPLTTGATTVDVNE